MKVFVSHTQAQLKALRVSEGKCYKIEYLNKDYFNGQETVEIATGKAVEADGSICFNVMDPYGIEKMIMQARVIGR